MEWKVSLQVSWTKHWTDKMFQSYEMEREIFYPKKFWLKKLLVRKILEGGGDLVTKNMSKNDMGVSLCWR